jgi:putative ABC transport system permease protein
MTQRKAFVFELAFADLAHEWVLSLCMVLALAAVIAPLMLLMGLKHGVISTLRDRLVQDPRFREIKPAQTREYPEGWFETLRERPEVGFLMPTVLPASSILSVIDPQGGSHKLWDLVPSGAGDPLLLENSGLIPQAGQCVLSSAAAEQLAVQVGDSIDVKATRSRGGKREAGEQRLQVAAILDPRAGAAPRIYAPLQFVLDVESYKEGMGVPERGWKGSLPRPYLSLDGVMVVLPEPLRPVEESGLVVNTGFSRIGLLDAADFTQRTGFAPPAYSVVYDIATHASAVTFSSYRALLGKLRGRGAVLLPYADLPPLEIDGEPMEVFGLSLSAEKAKILGIEAPPWGRLSEKSAGERWRGIQFPAAAAVSSQEVSVSLQARGQPLRFPLRNRGSVAGNKALMPVELVGALRTAQQRPVRYDAGQGELLLERGGYRGFRLFTRNIDQVPDLVRELRGEGIEVIAEIEAIERIRVLDQGLSRIFWLVALVGVAGGIAALIASLYASVERKKQPLGVMRLLGFSRRDMFRFPVYQGVMIALFSLATASAGYFLLSSVINRVFAADLALGQRICYLPVSYLGAAALGALLLAWASTLFAAWKSTRIDPAEALRYE